MGFWQFATGGGSGGSGDVAGPAVAVSGNIASFSGITGKIIADSGVAAASVVVGPSSATDNAFVRFDQATGKLVQNGVLVSDDFNGDLTGPATNTATSVLGTAFTNQPSNDSVTVVSDSALDITQTVTIIGNTTATDSIVTEDILLTGIVGVVSTKVDWGQILAVKLSAACVGTVTIQKTTGPATITTIAPAATSAGVFSGSLSAYSRAISFSSNGATTKHAGISGTNSLGATIYEGATLSGTTLVAGISTFVTVSELYIGDLENTRSLIITATGGTKLNSAYLLTGTTGSVDDAILISNGTGGQSVAASAATLTAAGSLTIPSAETLEWSTDTGLARSAAGVVKVTDGSTGLGKIVASNTTGAGHLMMGGTTTAAHKGIGLDSNGVVAPLDGAGSVINFRCSSLGVPGGTIAFNASLSGFPAFVLSGNNLLWKSGASAPGPLMSSVLVEANTAGSGSPNIITALESRTVFTNEGSGAKNYHTLPTAVAGYKLSFIVQDADGIRIVANTDDTIRVIDKVTAAAGYIESTTIGSTVTLVSINAVEWYATSIKGTWTDGTFTYDDTSLTTP